ncbi:MAG: glycosyltransferase family 39 protein [Bryobacterales bacterium]|nr:glycosyltransferase family 39 protein [Bryobacterales bacterium]
MASPTEKNSTQSWVVTLLVAFVLAGLAAAATWWVNYQGYTLYNGDAQAHLNIARRVLDSRTPGMLQIGTVWLPLPHLIMMPLAGDDALWASGLAGAIPVSVCFWLGAMLFYLAMARLLESHWAALAGVAALALNPNLLYLQATPMTEAIFLAAIGGLFYGCVRFAENPGLGWSLFAGLFALAGALTRYDGWFVLPFVALFLVWKGQRRRWFYATAFCVVAGAGPLWWLGHNWWFWGDALEFYRGPYSAKAIYQRQLTAGMEPFPADGNWLITAQYYFTAARLVAGWPLFAIGLLGAVLAAVRGPRWMLALLLAPSLFYMLSMHNGGTPIFVPELWPYAHYNTRYGLALLPVLALGLATVVKATRPLWRPWSVMAGLLAASLPWMLAAGPESWICWKEGAVNSVARRQWLGDAATYMKRMYLPGSGILLSFGDLTGVLQLAGIPLRESLHEGNHPWFRGATNKPQYFFREEWALCHAGDDVAQAMVRAKRAGMPVAMVKQIRVGNAAPVEIWRRRSEFAGEDLSLPKRRPSPLAGLDLPGWERAAASLEADAAPGDGSGEEEADGNTLR